ncbi:MAG TPA: DUF1588 domain-containing protein, partial [Planctomycetota bacterium]
LTFIDQLRLDNRSVFELLKADYAWVNEDLAKHYGLPGVKGDKFTRVALPPDSPRGGLLGMGAVLAMTSHTHRTSPTLRGKWILDVLLGTPPPPPPPDAGTIKEDKKGKDPRSFRELLAQHAGAPVCASCHRRIDPLGFALEGFNAVGEARETSDAAGALPTGERFNGARELREVLVGRRDRFLRNLVEQALSYALGRELGSYDDAAVREIEAAAAKEGYTFSSIFLGVARSHPFRHRRT